jgi:sugar phosphate permease
MKMDKVLFSKRVWIFLGLMMIYIIAYLCRKAPAYCAPYLLEFFSATKMDWANIVALTSAAYGLGRFVLPYIADKYKKIVLCLEV